MCYSFPYELLYNDTEIDKYEIDSICERINRHEDKFRSCILLLKTNDINVDNDNSIVSHILTRNNISKNNVISTGVEHKIYVSLNVFQLVLQLFTFIHRNIVL